MVLVATVTKTTVSDVMSKLWRVNLTLTDAGKAVIDKDYALPYRPGDVIDKKKVAPIIAAMQEEIDQYKFKSTLNASAAFKTLAATVQDGLKV